MDVLLLRLDAPLMSFGGVIVDENNVTDRFPGLSLLTGLFANALGWRHGDAQRLESLQARIVHAARWDVEPEPLFDYQTVDLGQEHLVDTGWTTRGEREERGKGGATRGTHIRRRHHLANGLMTLAVALSGDGRPGLDALEQALRRPVRPLFIGRKPCLPAAPMLLGRVQAPGLKAALQSAPRAGRPGSQTGGPMLARWPVEDGAPETARLIEVYDRRDWRHQVHLGQRRMVEGLLETAP